MNHGLERKLADSNPWFAMMEAHEQHRLLTKHFLIIIKLILPRFCKDQRSLLFDIPRYVTMDYEKGYT